MYNLLPSGRFLQIYNSWKIDFTMVNNGKGHFFYLLIPDLWHKQEILPPRANGTFFSCCFYLLLVFSPFSFSDYKILPLSFFGGSTENCIVQNHHCICGFSKGQAVASVWMSFKIDLFMVVSIAARWTWMWMIKVRIFRSLVYGFLIS